MKGLWTRCEKFAFNRAERVENSFIEEQFDGANAARSGGWQVDAEHSTNGESERHVRRGRSAADYTTAIVTNARTQSQKHRYYRTAASLSRTRVAYTRQHFDRPQQPILAPALNRSVTLLNPSESTPPNRRLSHPRPRVTLYTRTRSPPTTILFVCK